MKKEQEPSETTSIRQNAGLRVKKRISDESAILADADIAKLFHELQEYQIELEMQNEELQLAKEKAEKATEKYTKLYDFAPSGYFTLNSDSSICELNFNGAKMLGKERSKLINSNFDFFISPDKRIVFTNFLDKVFQTKTKQTCDLELFISEKPTMFVHMEGVISEDEQNCFLTVINITDQKEAQNYSTFFSNAVLELVQFKTSKDVFVYTVNKLYDFFNGSVIIAGVEYDNPNNRWKMQEVKGINSILDNGLKKIGIDLRNMEGEINTPFLPELEKGKLAELEFDLKTLTNGKISGKINSIVKKLTPIKKLLVIPIKTEEIIYGTITLVITQKNAGIERKLNETFITQIAVFVEKLLLESELRENEKKLTEAEKIAHIGNYEIDLKTNNAIWSEETFRIYGIEYKRGKEITISEYGGLIHPDDSLNFNNYYQQCIAENRTFNLVYRIIRADKEIRFVHIIGELEINERGIPVKMFGTLQDITEQKTAELKLLKTEKRATELAIVNKELEQFSYLASHDLQEPLQTVTNFINVFEEDYNEILDDTARKYLLSVKTAIERMRKRIKSLLDFSRLGRNSSFVHVDCKKLIDKVISDLDTIIKASGAIIEVGEMPELNLYEVEIREMFQNLISNAIKFQKKGNRPKIIIRADQINNTWKFSISDNGIGIAPIYFERIFDVFQRLHADEEYDGTGIGLASCKKIAQLHQGEIWVESTPGKGTSFYFTLQKLTYEQKIKVHHTG